MGKPKAPEPPDPRETSAAQTGTNVATAVANTSLRNVNQYTPYGSLTYRQTGTTRYTDPYTGDTHVIPTYSSATTLSPAEQRIYDADADARFNLAGTAADQSAFLREYLGQPFDYKTASAEIENYLDDLYSARMEPDFARDEEALRTRLTQSGLQPGSAAWNAEMENFGRARTDARTQMALMGRGQAFSELMALRNQPINEITALLSGSQVNNPQVAMAQPAQIPTVDNAGLIMDNYRQRQANYQQQMQQRQALMGGLFDVAAAGFSGGFG